MNNPITIICGHYGSGKTNLTMNLAVEAADRGEQVTVVDMDVVNPYFRSSEYKQFFEEKGIELIAPTAAGTTLDTPAISADVYKAFQNIGTVFIDVGGDDAGATALGRFSEDVKAAGYEMLYVINRYRILSQEPEQAAVLLKEIEGAARLSATGIVNNSHMGVETKPETVTESLAFSKEVSRLTGLPLLYTTAPDFAPAPDCKIIQRYVLFPWEMEENC